MDGFESDRRSLRAKLNVGRREMLTVSLAAGFAAAVHPVAAQTVIHTDSEGLEAGQVSIPTADRDIPAYRAMPAKPGTFAVIMVVQEIFGVHEHIRDVCRRLAKQGYMAIAPELYARQGSVADIADPKDIIARVVSKVPDKQVMSDPDATVAFAQASEHGDTARLGITGFAGAGASPGFTRRTAPNSKPASPGTARSSATALPIRRVTRSIWLPSSKRPCLASMAPPTKAFRLKQSIACAPRAKPPESNARLSCTRILRMPSTPTTARATAPKPRRMRGRACSPGSARTVSPEQDRNRSVITEG
jgi:dienelactone hydrolase family protein